jgi:hypothetical protein
VPHISTAISDSINASNIYIEIIINAGGGI